ncbi:ATP-binding protein [Amycolatopsis sp. NBC_00355]|uniref:ATP-binding protein n=1 Tax=Amycolatopsis sp. NBC_00355 TaxID=2975957 RepID=UPI002E25E04D
MTTPPCRDEYPSTSSALPPNSRGIGLGGDSSGINSTGDNSINMQVVHAAPVIMPMEQVIPLSALGNTPAVPDVFVGREEDLQRVEYAMAGPGPVVVTAVQGLGGVGKSTLAARYSALHRGEHSLVWWITADAPSAIEIGLARMAVALQPAVAGLALEQQTEHGIRWLSSHPGWLLILDNLEAPTDASMLLERMSHGRVLITSRRAAGWHSTGTALPLDVLDPDDAVSMLTRIIVGSRPATDCAGAVDLCAERGGFRWPSSRPPPTSLRLALLPPTIRTCSSDIRR